MNLVGRPSTNRPDEENSFLWLLTEVTTWVHMVGYYFGKVVMGTNVLRVFLFEFLVSA